MTCMPSRISTFFGVADDLRSRNKNRQNLKREYGILKKILLSKVINTYFCPVGPNPSSPYCAWPQLMQEESAPTKWCILPESMQRMFQPL